MFVSRSMQLRLYAKPETSMRRRAIGMALLLLAPWILHGQEASRDTSGIPSARSSSDTVRVLQLAPLPSADTSSHARRGKSTAAAMLLSAALPGAGQFYNQSYWKVPVIAGLGIYFVSGWLDNNRKARDYRDQYSASLLREFYKDQRDAFAWYFLVLYMINIADAYVDASLFDFNVGGDLSSRRLPPEPGLPQASLTIRVFF
jgi:hypothetical protein